MSRSTVIDAGRPIVRQHLDRLGNGAVEGEVVDRDADVVFDQDIVEAPSFRRAPHQTEAEAQGFRRLLGQTLADRQRSGRVTGRKSGFFGDRFERDDADGLGQRVRRHGVVGGEPAQGEHAGGPGDQRGDADDSQRKRQPAQEADDRVCGRVRGHRVSVRGSMSRREGYGSGRGGAFLMGWRRRGRRLRLRTGWTTCARILVSKTNDLRACLAANYGLDVEHVRFLPLGHDVAAAVYRVSTGDGEEYLAKVRFGVVDEPALAVPRALLDAGIEPVLAPLRTRSGVLWSPLTARPRTVVVLYPFVRGENAVVAGLTAAQWRTFGATLRAIHDLAPSGELRRGLREETFALGSAALVRRLSVTVAEGQFTGVAERFAAFSRAREGRIAQVLARAEALAGTLRRRSFAFVPCHADIHAANILAGEDGRIWLIDWDGPMFAPRERDLLFVIGSRIARPVASHEEAWFFAGYGPVEIDPEALIYYRYERIIEDIGEFGRSVLEDPPSR